MRIGWSVDNHWESLGSGIRENRIHEHCEHINKEYDFFVNCGDIATSKEIKYILQLIGQRIRIPYYFVLGNHDYYFSEVSAVKNLVSYLSTQKNIGRCIYGSISPGEILSSNNEYVKFVFSDSCASGLPYNRSLVVDETCIKDFKDKNPQEQLQVRNKHSVDGIKQLKRQLANLRDIKEIYIFTHVPPFTECNLHHDKPSEEQYHPFFTDVLLGIYLETLERDNPDLKIKVLCGHTHNKAHYIKGNIEVFVSHGEYGKAFINEIIL